MLLTAAGTFMTTSDVSDAHFYLAPFKRVAIGGATAADKNQSSIFVEIQVP